MNTYFLHSRRHTVVLVSVTTICTALLGACNSSATKTSTLTASAPPVETSSTKTTTPAEVTTPSETSFEKPSVAKPTATGPVLPVESNPINNAATAKTLNIDSVLVENNVDSTGKSASDHLEIALRNTGTTELSGLEVFYSFTDPTTGTSESYYAKLPTNFTIPAGGKRVAHFDESGQPDHFPVNKFSLYYTSTNALDVSVTVSAKNAAIQKLGLKKDAGGAEAAD